MADQFYPCSVRRDEGSVLAEPIAGTHLPTKMTALASVQITAQGATHGRLGRTGATSPGLYIDRG